MTNPELNVFIETHLFHHSVTLRWCSYQPDCGGYNEIESLYEEVDDERYSPAGLQKEISFCNDPARIGNNPHYQQLSCYQDGRLWELVPDYTGDIKQAWRVIEYLNAYHSAEQQLIDYPRWVKFYEGVKGNGNIFGMTSEQAARYICESAVRACGIKFED